MDYQFENLGPERFQQFCQALLVKEFPNVQCFPVAQPDGGRDALVYMYNEKSNTSKSFMVFQIKFVRRPQVESEPHVWLTKIMEEEAPKASKLIKEGAEKYFLLTNIPGTAHHNSGSIDKVSKIFSDVLEIPFQCWWRDDLNRRLDNAWNLKWVYPELMSGLDILHYVFQTGLSEEKERRTNAIRTFVRAQYDLDQEVRFKQIELQNNLLDLFIDVPIKYKHGKEDRKHSQIYSIISHQQAEVKENKEELLIERSYELSKTVGAATFLLHDLVQNHIPQLVLEGAPGQGKSTIVQYICQVHRMHILQEQSHLNTIPLNLQPASVRIPFKVDLRDLATWLNKQDPFSSDDSNMTPDGWQKSLESFLAFQVKTLSGGINFTVTDLHAIAKLSAILLVLDGLDEVAEISKRQEIIAIVKIGVNRLRESCASLQVIVTSRPTAFAKSGGFPETTYPYYELISITKPLINAYAGKWIIARRLNNRDRADVKRILRDKLDQPHLRDLARNPMQLAILLSLIHERGASLPDKRTALYDKYVELFFSRESDKSPIIRDYRELVIDIHRYLAWVLHTEAETGGDRGSISHDRLLSLLFEYLKIEGYDPSIAEKLFESMVLRVVALVSRVQGTYEFEVQPLREYFAARFLYETAPYSPPGSERKGTKPDRFDAIARNFYWLNVTRFYAGCFSKGELPTLVDSLEVLAKADGYRNINHPRTLASVLLSDWVFAQNQRSMRNVIKLILEGLNIRSLSISSYRTQTSDEILTLPRDCGRDELLDECFSILRSKPIQDYAMEVIQLIKANASEVEISERWLKEVSNIEVSERTIWLRYSFHLGISHLLPLEEMKIMISDNPTDPIRIGILLQTRVFTFFETSEENCKAIVSSILNRDIVLRPRRVSKSILSLFCYSFDTSPYNYLSFPSSHYSLSEATRRFGFGGIMLETIPQNKARNETLKKCMETIVLIRQLQDLSVREWVVDSTPWNTFVEKSRTLWGDQWAFFHIASLASCFRFANEKDQDFSILLDSSKPLCSRAYYAKSKGRSPEWWKRQFTMASTEQESMFVSLMFILWSNSNVILNLAEFIDGIFTSFSEKVWQKVILSAEEALRIIRSFVTKSPPNLDIEMLSSNLSERTIAAIGMRLKPEKAEKLYLKYLFNYQNSEFGVLNFCQTLLLTLVKTDTSYWQQALVVIANAYAKGINFEYYSLFRELNHPEGLSLPISIAEEITKDAAKYPRELVAAAEVTCRENVASKIISVAEIAQKENWFTLP